MSAPKRVQLRRTRGWRKPDGAIVVSRPSKFGNPWRVELIEGLDCDVNWCVTGAEVVGPDGSRIRYATIEDARASAVYYYRTWLIADQYGCVEWLHPNQLDRLQSARQQILDGLHALRGYDLACWCPVGGLACHADVLLKLANQEGL